MTDTVADMTESRWLSDDERGLWLRLQAIAEYIPSAVDTQLRKDAGLTRYEYYVMAMLSEAPSRSRLMSDLAVATNGSLSRLSHAVNRLEKQSWISRATHESDRRATVATLTEAGMAKVIQSAPGHVDAVRTLLFDKLSPAEVEALAAALMPVIRALDLPPFPGEATAAC